MSSRNERVAKYIVVIILILKMLRLVRCYEVQVSLEIQTEFDKISSSQGQDNDLTSRRIMQGERRLFTFLEQYHFPMTPKMCEEFSEEKMLSFKDDFTTNPYFERYLVWKAVKQAIGQDSVIQFVCTQNYEQTTLNHQQLIYAGKFGSIESQYLENDDYWMSIPTLHNQNLFMQKKNLSPLTSQSIFSYLNYLFYLAIFVVPVATGLILLVFKNLNSFYDYQRVVFSVFRYLNRQGDQQMRLWMIKILCFFVAMFFFFHYSILLSQMTVIRTQANQFSFFNQDSYHKVQNYQEDIFLEGKSFYFVCADSYQFHFLKNGYNANSSIQDNRVTYYNLLLSKNFFSQEEYESIQLSLLQSSQEHSTQLFVSDYYVKIHNNDIFINWIFIAIALIIAIVFKMISTKFSSINQYTEIKSFREGKNLEIVHNFGEQLAQTLNRYYEGIQGQDNTSNFRMIQIPKKVYFIGKQIYKIIDKKHKKIQKHKKKKKLHNAENTKMLDSNKQNLYTTIKRFIELNRKSSETEFSFNRKKKDSLQIQSSRKPTDMKTSLIRNQTTNGSQFKLTLNLENEQKTQESYSKLNLFSATQMPRMGSIILSGQNQYITQINKQSRYHPYKLNQLRKSSTVEQIASIKENFYHQTVNSIPLAHEQDNPIENSSMILDKKYSSLSQFDFNEKQHQFNLKKNYFSLSPHNILCEINDSGEERGTIENLIPSCFSPNSHAVCIKFNQQEKKF